MAYGTVEPGPLTFLERLAELANALAAIPAGSSEYGYVTENIPALKRSRERSERSPAIRWGRGRHPECEGAYPDDAGSHSLGRYRGA